MTELMRAKKVGASCCAVAVAVTVMGAPAWSASVRVLPDTPQIGIVFDLKVEDFARLGECGGGDSVVNNGCSTVIKRDPDAPHAYGRFDPLTHDYWIDSQDIDKLKWTVTSPVPFSTLIFALTDAHDQDDSHFVMYTDNGGSWEPIWDIPNRQENGNLYWVSVNYAEPLTSTTLLFSTKIGDGYDGYGIRAARISDQPAPIPLPASALMLLSATMLMTALHRRRKSAA